VHHWKMKNYEDRLSTQERIGEMQRRAAERADVALKGLFGETGGHAKRKQSRAKPKRLD
jgi:hypothetical protein